MINELENKFTGFKSADRPSLGLALIFDISGFTRFFNKPDLQYYITDYINAIIDCIEVTIWGGVNYWDPDEGEEVTKLSPLALKPTMRKFLGDGMLYLWEVDDPKSFTSDLKISLLNRIWNLQRSFSFINRRLYDVIPIGDLPTTIKVGIAQGTVYRLEQGDGSCDYIGPCINLASRLVKYSSEINFIYSARLDIPKQNLIENGYMKIIAKELRSFENEIVVIDKDDYDKLNLEEKERLFTKIPGFPVDNLPF